MNAKPKRKSKPQIDIARFRYIVAACITPRGAERRACERVLDRLISEGHLREKDRYFVPAIMKALNEPSARAV
jgi:hypothetical protein